MCHATPVPRHYVEFSDGRALVIPEEDRDYDNEVCMGSSLCAAFSRRLHRYFLPEQKAAELNGLRREGYEIAWSGCASMPRAF